MVTLSLVVSCSSRLPILPSFLQEGHFIAFVTTVRTWIHHWFYLSCNWGHQETWKRTNVRIGCHLAQRQDHEWCRDKGEREKKRKGNEACLFPVLASCNKEERTNRRDASEIHVRRIGRKDLLFSFLCTEQAFWWMYQSSLYDLNTIVHSMMQGCMTYDSFVKPHCRSSQIQ